MSGTESRVGARGGVLSYAGANDGCGTLVAMRHPDVLRGDVAGAWSSRWNGVLAENRVPASDTMLISGEPDRTRHSVIHASGLCLCSSPQHRQCNPPYPSIMATFRLPSGISAVRHAVHTCSCSCSASPTVLQRVRLRDIVSECISHTALLHASGAIDPVGYAT